MREIKGVIVQFSRAVKMMTLVNWCSKARKIDQGWIVVSNSIEQSRSSKRCKSHLRFLNFRTSTRVAQPQNPLSSRELMVQFRQKRRKMRNPLFITQIKKSMLFVSWWWYPTKLALNQLSRKKLWASLTQLWSNKKIRIASPWMLKMYSIRRNKDSKRSSRWEASVLTQMALAMRVTS